MTNPANRVDEVLKLRKWAIVGATDKPDRYGYKILVLLLERGYEVFPIHPTLTEIEGVACHPSIADLPKTPDVACFVVNPEIGLRVMDEAANAGVRVAWLQPGARSEALLAAARAKGVETFERCVLVDLAARPDLSFV